MGDIVQSGFRPSWWLPGGHLQTLWPALFRQRPKLELEWQRVELADGDFIDLAWLDPQRSPRVLVLHGLEGSLRSHYAGATLQALHAAGFGVVFMHLRGCSGEPNRLARGYHSGATEDLDAVMRHLGRTLDGAPDAAVGFSLGGNLLLKYLGEQGTQAAFKAAVAVSVPLVLADCAQRLEQGFSRVYRNHLLRSLKQNYQRKFSLLHAPLQVDLKQLRSFHAFDDRVTAPLHGFDGADDYYRRCSSRRFLPRINIPTLILQALNDPFMSLETLPDPHELGTGVTLEVSHGGGHVGFVSGALPWRAEYWLEGRIVRFLEEQIA